MLLTYLPSGAPEDYAIGNSPGVSKNTTLIKRSTGQSYENGIEWSYPVCFLELALRLNSCSSTMNIISLKLGQTFSEPGPCTYRNFCASRAPGNKCFASGGGMKEKVSPKRVHFYSFM